MSPFVLILVFKLGAGSAFAVDMPNAATCERAAQFSKGQEGVSAALQFYRRDESKP